MATSGSISETSQGESLNYCSCLFARHIRGGGGGGIISNSLNQLFREIYMCGSPHP